MGDFLLHIVECMTSKWMFFEASVNTILTLEHIWIYTKEPTFAHCGLPAQGRGEIA
jgi:hypothetical protein